MSCEYGTTGMPGTFSCCGGSVPRFTTPTFTLAFDEPDLDLTEATGVYVTFRNNLAAITKSGNELSIEPRQIEVMLTQEETGHFGIGKVEIQVNWVTVNGVRAASTVGSFEIGKQLMQRVVDQS